MPDPVRLSDVTPEEVQWVWPRRIPVRAITVLEGDPGVSKSTVCYEIAARLTTARLPYRCRVTRGRLIPYNVILMQAEDDAGTTIRPNLESMGADLRRIHVYDKRVLAEEPFYFPDAVPEIQRLIERERARLLVIDPITSFVKGSINSDQSVRKALFPLVAVAVRTNTAILIVRHLAKSGRANAMHQGAGSIALAGMARSILRIAENPDNYDERLLVQVKASLGRPGRSLRYRLVQGDIGVQVEWLGYSRYTAEDLAVRQLDRPAMEEAKQFLCSLLYLGELTVGYVRLTASENGIASRTLRRAKEELEIVSRRDRFGPGGRYYWALNMESEYVREFMRNEVDRKAAENGDVSAS